MDSTPAEIISEVDRSVQITAILSCNVYKRQRSNHSNLRQEPCSSAELKHREPLGMGAAKRADEGVT
jgi:hypothetical protein